MKSPSSITRLLALAALSLTMVALGPVLDPIGASLLRSQTMSTQQLNNLIAFTKLYGYVRFFHPSDEAAQADWDRLAIYGCSRMLQACDREEVKTALEEVFGPIAPTVRIFETGTVVGKDPANSFARDTARYKMVAWQHLGVRLAAQSVYSSIRLNRKNAGAGGNVYGFGTITSRLEPSGLRGKRIMLRAAVKVDQGSQGQLWLRVDRPGGKRGFFDNMDDRPISSTDWKYYEITGTVDSDAVDLYFGCLLPGSGKIWLDDLSVFSGEGDRRQSIKIPNSNFESDTLGVSPVGWSAGMPGYTIAVTNETASSGSRSVVIKSSAADLPSELFPERPADGESIIRELPGGISCEIPLVLYADSRGTTPRADKKKLEDLHKAMERVQPDRTSGNERKVRLADIVIAWNVFQHFYPYFDVTPVNWEDELPGALREAYADTNALDFLKTLEKFVARLRDGHGGVSLAGDTSRAFVAPIQWTWAENALVITATFDSSKIRLKVGDVVLTVNGMPAEEALQNEEVFASGATAQRRRLRALSRLLGGPRGSTLELVTEDEAGTKQTIVLTRTLTDPQFIEYKQRMQGTTRVIAPGVFYVNLSNTPMPVIDSLMPQLAAARGLICDLRGYPNGNHELISNLLTSPDTSVHWMAVPKVTYPDRSKETGYAYYGWQMKPRQPHIGGKVVFLTDGRAISYAESYMGFIEHYKLAGIVGEPTAGTNGNVNPLVLPGGYRIAWTGMKVTKHDGSRHHGVGIQPTLLVHPTVKGIREGRDEQLDAALQLISSRRPQD